MKRLIVTFAACLACGSPPSHSPAPAPAPTVLPPASPVPIVAEPAPPPPVAVMAAPEPAAPPAKFEPTAFTVEVAGSGRPIILIPGLGCPGAVWAETTRHLTKAKKPFETHTITAAGCAGRPANAKPPIAAMREELAAYIRDRKLDHPVVIGHSMGGFLAIWLAEAEPDLVGPVVVVDSSATLGGGDPDWEPYARKQREAYRTMPDARFEKTIRERFSRMFVDPVKHGAIIAAVARSDKLAYSEAYWELNTIDLRPELAKIKAPVLAILADGTPQKRYRTHLAPIKNLRIIMVSGARHFIMQDTPAVFYRALDSFLAEHR